jgi:hypothetical protein
VICLNLTSEQVEELIRGQRALLVTIEQDGKRAAGTSYQEQFVEAAKVKREFIAQLEEVVRFAKP